MLAEVVQANPHIAELRRRTRELPEGALHPDLVRLGEEVSAALDHKRTEDTDGILGLVGPHVLEMRERPGPGSTTSSTWPCWSSAPVARSSRTCSRGWRRPSTSGSG